MTRIARSAMILLIAFIALFADKDLRISQEIVLGSLFNIGIWLILRRFWPRLRAVPLDLDTIVLLLFAVGSTVQALGTHVETEIPRLRLILRAVYYGYLFFCLSPLRKRFTFAEHSLIALFLFTSLPFHWATIVGSARNILPAAILLYVLLRTSTAAGQRKVWFEGVFVAGGMGVLLFYGISQAVNGNWFDGMDGLARLFTGVACFLIVRSSEMDERKLPLAYSALLLVNIAFLLIAAGFALHGDPTLIKGKRLALGGINTNDIGGYFAVAAPISVAAFMAADSRRSRVLAVVCMLGAAGMIILAQARLAWPTVLVCVLWMLLRMRVRGGFDMRKSVLLGAGLAALSIVCTALVVLYLPAETLNRFDLTTLDYRFALIRQAALILSENPLQGTGVGNLAAFGAFPPGENNEGLLRFLAIAGGFVHAHNLLLQVWMEGGLAYLLLNLFVFVAGFAHLFTKQQEGRVAPVVLLSIFLQGLLNYHFDVYHVWLLFWTSAALVVPAVPRILEQKVLPAIACVVLVCVFGYHSVVVTMHSQAMQSVRGFRYRHFLGAMELKDLPGAATHSPPRLAMFDRAVSLYPLDRRLSQEAGEAHFYPGRAGQDFQRAASLYRNCANHEVNPSFCFMRLSTIAELAGEPAQVILDYKSQSRAHDPMDLVSRTALSPF